MKFFLIGQPLSHSYSADYFDKKFKSAEIDSTYDLCPLESIENLPQLIKSFGKNLGGFNVTSPYKVKVKKFLASQTKEAELAGAVNCVRPEIDGSLTGHNTDIEGFRRLLFSNAKFDLIGSKAIIIGGGGVFGAVRTVFDSEGVTPIVTVRDPEKFRTEHPDFNGKVIKLSELGKNEILEVNIIVNTTPLGTFPNIMAAPPIPYEYIQPRHLCLDLVYNPTETLFTKICSAHGAKAVTGMEMLIEQAEASWRFWNRLKN